MAENALYISSIEHVKPTIFELLSQESLMDTLHPSYNLLCSVCRNYCRKIQWFFQFQEEWFLFFNFVLQSQYLRLFKASFSETFYGLKRVPAQKNSSKLSFYSKAMSLFCLVGLPYLSVKVKNKFESYYLKVASSSDDKKKVQAILISYKGVIAVYEITRLCYLVGYMSGRVEYYSPLLKLAGVKLIYQNVETSSWSELFMNYSKNKKPISSLVTPVVLKFFFQFLELGAFTIQFLSWWHSDEIKTKLNSLPIPPPLQIVSNRKMLCPICNKPRKVEVVLPSSGYLFCYRCIKDELQTTGKCPVTNLSASPNQLIRVYTEI